jgi:hypothetical protein
VLQKTRHDGRAGLQHGLTDDKALHLALDPVGIDELPAGHLIEAQPRRREAVFVGVLHLRLAFDKSGQQVVAEYQIACGADQRCADERQQRGSAEQNEARNFETAALMTARHVHDVIRGVFDKLKRPFTQGHVALPDRLRRRRCARKTATPGKPRPRPRRKHY